MQNEDSVKIVMIIAGEASGDLHGSNLVKALKQKHKHIFFCGIGGDKLREEGVRTIIDSSTLAVVGITEVFAKLPSILKGFKAAKLLLSELKPDLLIIIDFPDFNMKVANIAKKMKIPVLYYITPQIWAWRQGRIKKIKKIINHAAVILPFEEAFFKKHNVKVTFVGHPLLDIKDLPYGRSVKTFENDFPKIGLLPGSREGEIKRHLPVMLSAAQILKQKMPNVKFLISIAQSSNPKLVHEIINENLESTLDFEVIHDVADKIFEQADMVVAASGTVTLEAAISGVPMIIIYKISKISYTLGKALIKVKNIGLVNLIAGREIVPELVQDKANPKNIANTICNMLRSANNLNTIKKNLISIRDLLGGKGASNRVADIVMEFLK
ncbi:MAG: lipid-A-disaccharide synthase [Desulfobacterales bacterium]|nr:lipid-A-disaccharide synthase [Desulfobacterales bacterium]